MMLNSGILEVYMVKSDTLSQFRILGAFTVIIGIIGAIWIAIRWEDIARALDIVWLVPLGAALFWYVSPWAQVERRRQSAALQENTSVPLAAAQPAPDKIALTLPCTIKLRPKWKPPLICFALLVPLTSAALLIYVYMVPTNPPEPPYAALIAVGICLFWSALVASIPLLLGWRSIKVTERGIKVQECTFYSWGCHMSIKWSEIRLFAIYRTRKPTDPRVCYELAGRTAIVRWRRMRPDAPFPFTKPPASFDEYDRQMDALLSLIAAKTRLPLYDLR